MCAADLILPLHQLPDPLPIPMIERPFDAVLTPPGSKSLTNRALLLAALARGTSTLRNALTEADDARVMVRALGQLGAHIEPHPSQPTTLSIRGVGGKWKLKADRESGSGTLLNLHNAGTATRFLAAAALLAPRGGSITIDGDDRMRQRPIGELVDALTAVGGRVEFLGALGCPPIPIPPNHRYCCRSHRHQTRPRGAGRRSNARQSPKYDRVRCHLIQPVHLGDDDGRAFPVG